MEFADLNDEIGADNWLIHREEISRKRLIKQTTRYKIYKADWFGDVLLYEPVIKNIKTSKTRQKQENNKPIDETCLSANLYKLNLKLDSFNEWQSSLQTAPQCPLSPTTSLCSESGSLESGYSSLSSTPRYYAKQNLKSEFEFPSGAISTSTSLSSLALDEIGPTTNNDEQQEQAREQYGEEPGNASNLKYPRTTFPVVLNKDSFRLGTQSSVDENNYCRNMDSCLEEAEVDESSSQHRHNRKSSWFELNELRLIAHENFMLFMGACVESETFGQFSDDQHTTLVMQMSHPKAVSLFNLLHAEDSATLSPLERFFGTAYTRTRALSLEVKLNICQQVTNAMTYLHDKHIVHGKLTSVNIYVELNQQVKISLLDNDEQQLALFPQMSQNNETDLEYLNGEQCYPGVAFSLPALTYLGPELVRTIEVNPVDSIKENVSEPARLDLRQLTHKSDIFSFGTLLFELFEERYPFTNGNQSEVTATKSPLDKVISMEFENTPLFTPTLLHSAHRQQSPFVTTTKTGWNGNIKTSASELIFQIGSGQIDCRNKLRPKCPTLVDRLITACWAKDSERRPNFKQLSFKY